MDDFVLAYTLESLEKQMLDQKQAFADYVLATSNHTVRLVDRIDELEEGKTAANKSITILLDLVDKVSEELKETQNELNKSHMVNIKQDMIVRTLHNLQFYDGHDMHVDTFANVENIDMDTSIRAEWSQALQAIGKTNNPYVKIKQDSVPNRVLISKDGSSDEAVVQTFLFNEEQTLGKISFFAEAHSTSSYAGVRVILRKTLQGTPIVSIAVPRETIKDDWIDVTFPKTTLDANQLYYLAIETNDPNGYRIGADLTDRYLEGTSYGIYNGMSSDNNHDIGFKIWCYPTVSENDAYVITKPKKYDTIPHRIIFDTEEVIGNSSIINYFVSRDAGVTWKILQPTVETDLDDLPEGHDIVLKAHLVGSARINAWGYVIKRGDTV